MLAIWKTARQEDLHHYPETNFELSPEESLGLFKQVYALADSGDIRHQTFDDSLQIDLEIMPVIIVPLFYCKFKDYRP